MMMNYTNKITTTGKRITKEGKKLLQEKANQENLAAAINTLENIEANYTYKVNRNSKDGIHELIVLLNREDRRVPLSVRASTVISLIDSLTQDRRLASYVRAMLWQVVASLEGIKE